MTNLVSQLIVSTEVITKHWTRAESRFLVSSASTLRKRTPPTRYKIPTASHADPVSMNQRVSRCRPVLSFFAGATQFMAGAVSWEALGLGRGLRISKCTNRPCNSRTVLRDMRMLNSPSPEVSHATAFPGCSIDQICPSRCLA